MKPRRPVMRPLIGCALGLWCAAQAAAHDFWIEPASFSPAPGQVMPVRLLVGEHLLGDPVARPAADNMNRFVVASAGHAAGVTLPGRAGADPAGFFRAPAAGAYVIGYHGKQIEIELPAEKFNAYLREEGLESILARRAERGQLERAGREIYSRCAKSLVFAGRALGPGGSADQALGFPLELIAERAPWSMRGGDSLPVRLLYQGRALAGALVVAMPRAAPHEKVARRSDADGRVELPLGRSGPWLVKAVHMVEAAAGSGADWESLWASLSFSSFSPSPMK